MMQDDTLYKLTGAMSLGFGIYCLAMAFLVMAFQAEALSLIFAVIFMAMGIMYIIAGISILRKGRMGFILFFGFFGSTMWWSTGIPIYIWPMIIMPLVIIALFVILFLKQFSGHD